MGSWFLRLPQGRRRGELACFPIASFQRQDNCPELLGVLKPTEHKFNMAVSPPKPEVAEATPETVGGDAVLPEGESQAPASEDPAAVRDKQLQLAAEDGVSCGPSILRGGDVFSGKTRFVAHVPQLTTLLRLPPNRITSLTLVRLAG